MFGCGRWMRVAVYDHLIRDGRVGRKRGSTAAWHDAWRRVPRAVE